MSLPAAASARTLPELAHRPNTAETSVVKNLISRALLLLGLSALPLTAWAQSLPAHYRVTNNLPYVTGVGAAFDGT